MSLREALVLPMINTGGGATEKEPLF